LPPSDPKPEAGAGAPAATPILGTVTVIRAEVPAKVRRPPLQPKIDRRPNAQGFPFEWTLLAWAALVGISTGLAIVAFHEVLDFLNNYLFGPFVEGLLEISRSPVAVAAAARVPEAPVTLAPPPAHDGATPLKALLQLGLGSIGFLTGIPPAAAPAPLPPPGPAVPDWLALWPVVVVPTLGGLAVGVLRRFGGPLGPGVPSLMAMAEGVEDPAPIPPLLRLLTAALSLGSGASLGPEGPSVESGGNLGLWWARLGRLSPQSQQTLVAAGVAAGLAAGFKAPIAGVFFAFEGNANTSASRPNLRAVLVAAVASALVTQLLLGDEPILRLPAYEVRSPLELPLYLGLGVLASLMSLALIKLMAAGRNGSVQRLLEKLPPGLATALGGAAVGAMALAFPQVLGVGYDTIEALLGSDQGIPLITLASLLLVKLLATSVSNATGFVGGGFAPALFLGATLGSVYGQLLGEGGLGLPVAEAPAYAMVGMAAVLAGSVRAPLTALLLLFELTRDIRIVLPLMAAAGLSAALVDRWQSVKPTTLLGADRNEERRRERLAALNVIEALEPEAPLVLPTQTPAATALSELIAAHGHCLLVVDEAEANVVGIVTLADIQQALNAAQQRGKSLSLGECRRNDLVWLADSAHLDDLEDQLGPQGIRQVPVFAVTSGPLPRGLPASGLGLDALRGLASRDGLAIALARHDLQEDISELSLPTKALATGST
jgi:H+/Cl- antiporter ClcA